LKESNRLTPLSLAAEGEQAFRRMRTRALLLWAPLLAWLVLIYLLSAQSHLPAPKDRFWDEVFTKSAHFGEYAVLAFLSWRAFTDSGRRPQAIWRLSAWLLCLLYAASDEYHQTFVAYRYGDIGDWSADALGATVAILLMSSAKAAALARRVERKLLTRSR
jgi:VanZ family protein